MEDLESWYAVCKYTNTNREGDKTYGGWPLFIEDLMLQAWVDDEEWFVCRVPPDSFTTIYVYDPDKNKAQSYEISLQQGEPRIFDPKSELTYPPDDNGNRIAVIRAKTPEEALKKALTSR